MHGIKSHSESHLRKICRRKSHPVQGHIHAESWGKSSHLKSHPNHIRNHIHAESIHFQLPAAHPRRYLQSRRYRLIDLGQAEIYDYMRTYFLTRCPTVSPLLVECTNVRPYGDGLLSECNRLPHHTPGPGGIASIDPQTVLQYLTLCVTTIMRP